MVPDSNKLPAGTTDPLSIKTLSSILHPSPITLLLPTKQLLPILEDAMEQLA